MTHQVFEKIQAAVQSGSFSKITFSLPADSQTLRMSAKPFDRKGEIWIQFERLCRDGKALHENLPAQQAAQRVLELLDGWTGEKHVFRSPKDCARFLAKLEREGQTWRKF